MADTTAAVRALDKLADQLSDCLNPEAARRVIGLTVDEATQARVAALAEKANQGEITADELEEYKSYVETADLLAILKLKARRLLAAKDGA